MFREPVETARHEILAGYHTGDATVNVQRACCTDSTGNFTGKWYLRSQKRSGESVNYVCQTNASYLFHSRQVLAENPVMRRYQVP